MIARLKNKEGSNKGIARVLGRSASTIGREIKRNSFQGKKERFYEPLHAQEEAETIMKKVFKAMKMNYGLEKP